MMCTGDDFADLQYELDEKMRQHDLAKERFEFLYARDLKEEIEQLRKLLKG